MIINGKIANPLTVLNNKTLVFSETELRMGRKDFEFLEDNKIRSTSVDPWIEINNIRERLGSIRSVVYKVKPIVKNPSEEGTVLNVLHYADTNQEYSGYRRITKIYSGDTTVINIPPYAGPIDKLRLNLTMVNDMTLEVTEISLNTDALFSFPLFILIYGLWLLLLFLDPRPRSLKAADPV
jgi:hypothetical protein